MDGRNEAEGGVTGDAGVGRGHTDTRTRPKDRASASPMIKPSGMARNSMPSGYDSCCFARAKCARSAALPARAIAVP
jgi:hypothetical protein